MSVQAAYLGKQVPRIVLTGASGQLGRAIQRIACGTGADMGVDDHKRMDLAVAGGIRDVGDASGIAGGAQLFVLPHGALDITQRDAVEKMFNEVRPAVVINAAAYTQVDRAQQDCERAYAVNCAGVSHLAQGARQRGVAVFHVSTDYVFDGTAQRPYTEGDVPHPVNVYGHSKLAGEQCLLEAHSMAVVLRTSSVFGGRGQNFVNGVLKRAQAGSILEVVDDQVACPTAVADLAQALWQLVAWYLCGRPMVWGLFHYAGQPACSRYEWARVILGSEQVQSRLGHEVQLVPVSTKLFEGAALRPKYSVLDCHRIGDVYGIFPSDWRSALTGLMGAFCC